MGVLQDYFPAESYLMLDVERPLRWDIQAILKALACVPVLCGKPLSYSQFLERLCRLDTPCLTAALFGAAASADGSLMPQEFLRGCPELSEEITLSILQGIQSFLPDPDCEDNGEDLDEEWPDTQKELKSGGAVDIGDWVWIAKNTLGLSMEEIQRSSLRGIVTMNWDRLQGMGVQKYNGEALEDVEGNDPGTRQID